MHTLPLPEVTDNQQKTKIENGNSKLDSAQMAPRASNFAFRVPVNSPQETKNENGSLQPDHALIAPRVSSFGLRVSANSPHLTPQQLQFLLRVTPAALESQRAYEIPASVTIAQAILESATPNFGWGSSTLFRLANNPFGIKYCHFPSGDRVIGRSGDRGKDDPKFQTPSSGSPDHQVTAPSAHPMTGSLAHPITGSPDHPIEDYGHFDAQTWEIENGQKKVMIARFQRFPNLSEAFLAHALLLRGPRYAPAYAARGDWKQFAERLGPKASQLDREHCGYSTNPSYSAQLINLVRLYRLDDPRALEWYATGLDPGAPKPIAEGRLPTANPAADRPSAIENRQSVIFCDPEIGQ